MQEQFGGANSITPPWALSNGQPAKCPSPVAEGGVCTPIAATPIQGIVQGSGRAGHCVFA